MRNKDLMRRLKKLEQESNENQQPLSTVYAMDEKGVFIFSDGEKIYLTEEDYKNKRQAFKERKNRKDIEMIIGKWPE